MSVTAELGGHATGLATTQRQDRWWMGPLLTALGLGAFVVYATWAAFQGVHYWHGSYLSPLYSPPLFIQPDVAGAAPLEHAWLGRVPGWWPENLIHFSPAFLILVFPGAFRLTCYYYRKAYYRSYFAKPPACAVGASGPGKYRGERGMLIFQNLHRYALYFAILFIFILSYDAFLSFFENGDWRNGRFGVGVGSLVLVINVVLLGAYTFGCHSWRHIIGGNLDCFSCDALSRARYHGWKRVSWLNARHMLFAWLSLFWVAFADVYVRLVSMGIWTDWNTWG